MNIVIPMAGRGERFQRLGFAAPKPLIELAGVPLYIYASLSLPLELAARIVYVVLDSFPAHDIGAELRSYRAVREVSVVRLAEVTRGQSETVLHALGGLDHEQPLLIFNCDSYFSADFEWAAVLADTRLAGALVCFESSDPRYSFARADGTGRVDLVAEKAPISRHACTGAYYFRQTSQFRRIAEKRLAAGRAEQGEYFVAPLYNDLVLEGGLVRVFPAKDFICFGTPEELAAAQAPAKLQRLGEALRGRV